MTQQCTLATRMASHVHGGHQANWVREGILSLCSTLEQPHLEFWGQFGAPQYKKDIKLVEECPKKDHKDGEGSRVEGV